MGGLGDGGRIAGGDEGKTTTLDKTFFTVGMINKLSIERK